MNAQELYEFGKRIVKEAGDLLNDLKKQPLELEEKKDFSDLVTVVDKKVEQFLVDEILKSYPTHGILGEEGAFEGDLSSCENVWVIDPIDGTTNFIQNLPFYGISVGFVHEGKGIFGIVYNPMTNELFHALKGEGAFVNDTPLKLKKNLQLKEAAVSTTFIWEDNKTQTALHPALIDLYKDTRAVRLVGGAAISLCEVAKGSLSAYLMPALSPWDYTGGFIVAQEAGAIGSDLNGKPVQFEKNQSLLVANPSIHEELLNRFPIHKK